MLMICIKFADLFHFMKEQGLTTATVDVWMRWKCYKTGIRFESIPNECVFIKSYLKNVQPNDLVQILTLLIICFN